MLSLKKSSEFQKLFKSGKWYGEGFLSIYIEKNGTNTNKIGIAVGKKVAKSVKRNRMKRLIREAYRVHEKNFCEGYNIVVICKNDIEVQNIVFKDVEKNLIGCLNKASLIKNETNK